MAHAGEAVAGFASTSFGEINDQRGEGKDGEGNKEKEKIAYHGIHN